MRNIENYADLDPWLRDDERQMYRQEHFEIWKRIVQERTGQRLDR